MCLPACQLARNIPVSIISIIICTKIIYVNNKAILLTLHHHVDIVPIIKLLPGRQSAYARARM